MFSLGGNAANTKFTIGIKKSHLLNLVSLSLLTPNVINGKRKTILNARVILSPSKSRPLANPITGLIKKT
ncbi:hypothetical protein GCM10022271_07220 [Corallibacter vietnamensis]|uniref:Uncharacterized protein n=1 Tax=Corallibacter vietnamensis TaxID=904130 RepID=A0ABP7GX97_9FLAO